MFVQASTWHCTATCSLPTSLLSALELERQAELELDGEGGEEEGEAQEGIEGEGLAAVAAAAVVGGSSVASWTSRR